MIGLVRALVARAALSKKDLKMKTLRLVLILALVTPLALIGCKEVTVDPTNGVADILADGGWRLSSVIHEDEGDLTSHYDGMNIWFTHDGDNKGEYDVTSGGMIFDGPGTWTLTEGGSTHTLDLSNGLSIDCEIKQTSLVMTFFAASPGGRVKSLGGNYVFTFTR